MLYKLEVENFFSIREQQILDLTIDKKVPDVDGRYAPVFEGADIRAPKVVALYGANGSGKTTLLRALEFLINMIRNSVQQTGPDFPGCERFNDVESMDRPLRLAIEFGGIMNLTQEVLERAQAGETVEQGLYRYELEIEFKEGLSQRITHEALRQRPKGEGKWQRVYERNTAGDVKDSKSFSLSRYKHLVKTLAGNHTVLSSFAKFQHPSAKIFVEIARKCIFSVETVAHANPDNHVIDYLKTQPDMLSNLRSELSRIDIGVEGLRFQDTLNGPVLMFKHSGLAAEMPWRLESHGTRAFIKIFPFLIMGLANGGVVAIDEMDAAIHARILPDLLRWFYEHEARNKFDSQLWLTCHSASLLDDLNREEIVICEKDREGRSRFYSLMDVQIKVRRDDNHYKKYLGGAYGGVPLIG
jgi:energy-coupling factor transporter ATP-binding protein EcfA2